MVVCRGTSMISGARLGIALSGLSVAACELTDGQLESSAAVAETRSSAKTRVSSSKAACASRHLRSEIPSLEHFTRKDVSFKPSRSAIAFPVAPALARLTISATMEGVKTLVICCLAIRAAHQRSDDAFGISAAGHALPADRNVLEGARQINQPEVWPRFLPATTVAPKKLCQPRAYAGRTRINTLVLGPQRRTAPCATMPEILLDRLRPVRCNARIQALL